jgi:hypothetical protein
MARRDYATTYGAFDTTRPGLAELYASVDFTVT